MFPSTYVLHRDATEIVGNAADRTETLKAGSDEDPTRVYGFSRGLTLGETRTFMNNLICLTKGHQLHERWFACIHCGAPLIYDENGNLKVLSVWANR